MTLPTFLGIGVPRGGTTWLHQLLRSHPDVYMPTRRKELRFFERYYDRGLGWYSQFFCSPDQVDRYRAIGEISTQYYDCEPCPQRIAAALPECRLIVMLRHPVKRAYSHYGFSVQRGNFRGSFRDFLAARPRALEKGYYSRHLKRYLVHFDRSQVLALVSEEAFADPTMATAALAAFLGIAADGFPSAAAARKVNESSVPRHQALSGFVVKTGRRLRRRNLERVVDFVMRLGIQRVLARGVSLPPLDEGLIHELGASYLKEFDDLEECLDIDLGRWRT